MTENETPLSDASEAVTASLRRSLGSLSQSNRTRGQSVSRTHEIYDPSAQKWPTVISASLGSQSLTGNKGHGDHASVELYVPETLGWFSGHFPDQPVLPGVVQVHWAGQIGMHLFSIPTPFGSMSRLKFKTPVLPDCPLNLALTFKPVKQLLTFRYSTGSVEYSSGNLAFTASTSEGKPLGTTDKHTANR